MDTVIKKINNKLLEIEQELIVIKRNRKVPAIPVREAVRHLAIAQIKLKDALEKMSGNN